MGRESRSVNSWDTIPSLTLTFYYHRSSPMQGRTALSKQEILHAVYKSILSKYAMESDTEELAVDISSKRTRVAQGTELMLTGVAEGIGKEQMKVATDLVAAVKPYNWPSEAIAMQMLVMREILFEAGDDGYDPQQGR